MCMFTLRNGFSLVSMINSNLQSSQQRVSELLIHCCRQAWCTKRRLPVQWHGVISGLSSSPSQWQILHTNKGKSSNNFKHTFKVLLQNYCPDQVNHCGSFLSLTISFRFLHIRFLYRLIKKWQHWRFQASYDYDYQVGRCFFLYTNSANSFQAFSFTVVKPYPDI